MTSTEIVRQPQTPLPDRIQYAKALADSGLLPQAYRKQPANVLYAVEYGDALGVKPMTAIMGIHVIQGRPTLSADLMAALIRRAGHKLRVRVEPGPVAVAQVIRADDPGYTYECRWDMDRARRADLIGKDNWQHHPEAMLKARAISEVAREACSEVLNGLIYTPDELGAVVDADGHVLEGEIVETGGAGETRRGGAGSPGETQEPAPAPPPSQSPDDVATRKQIGRIGALMRERGMTDRALALEYVSGVVGRDVSSRNDLTKGEASDVIKALEADTVQEAPPHPDEAPVDEPGQQEAG